MKYNAASAATTSKKTRSSSTDSGTSKRRSPLPQTRVTCSGDATDRSRMSPVSTMTWPFSMVTAM